jgi:hypothetical protein
MLRLAACSLAKAQGQHAATTAALHMHAGWALAGKQAHQQQQISGLQLLHSTSPWLLHQTGGCPGQLQQPRHQQQAHYSQRQPDKPGCSSSGGDAGDSSGNSASSSGGSRTGSKISSGSSGSGSGTTTSAPPPGQQEEGAACILNSSSRSTVTAASINTPSGSRHKLAGGGVTAAVRKDRPWTAPAYQQQQVQQLQEMQAKLKQQQQLQQQQQQQLGATASHPQQAGGSTPLQQPPPHDLQHAHTGAPKLAYQQQKPLQSPLAAHVPSSAPPQQYKLVQYSRGNSTLLSIGQAGEGEYRLSMVKGPASAADLAALGQRKPGKELKDGQQAAPGAGPGAKGESAAQQAPWLLRPLLAQWQRVKKVMTATFLPAGYPTSVGSNYLEYTIWQVCWLLLRGVRVCVCVCCCVLLCAVVCCCVLLCGAGLLTHTAHQPRTRTHTHTHTHTHAHTHAHAHVHAPARAHARAGGHELCDHGQRRAGVDLPALLCGPGRRRHPQRGRAELGVEGRPGADGHAAVWQGHRAQL